MKTIIITGSVATGKTTLANELMKKLGYPLLDISKFIKEKKLSEYYDKKRRCKVIDVKKLNKEIIKEIKKIKKEHNPKGIIIDSHLSHYLPKRYVELCIVTKCELKALKKRLTKRKYSKNKVKENLECEIFDVCLNEAKERGHKVLVVDASKRVSIPKIIKRFK